MQKKSLIKENIVKTLEFKGISKYKFYQENGISRGVLDQKTGISEDNIARFLAYFPEINPNWLITGKGEMLLSKSEKGIHGVNRAGIPLVGGGGSGRLWQRDFCHQPKRCAGQLRCARVCIG